MRTSTVVGDVLALQEMKDFCVESALLGTQIPVGSVHVSTGGGVAGTFRIETFGPPDPDLADPRQGAADESSHPGRGAGGVWVGPRPADYRFEELLPKLKLRGIVLAIALISEAATEPGDVRLSPVTRHLAGRLGISLAVVRSGRSAISIAAEIDALLRREPVRQARELVELCALADAPDLGPALVGTALSSATDLPIVIVGPNEVIIWDSGGTRKGSADGLAPGARISVPIAGTDSGTRIDALGSGLSAAALEHVTPMLTLGALLLTRWYFDQRESAHRYHAAWSSLLSELAVVEGRVPGNLVALAASVGWPLEGWHVIISTKTTTAHSGMDTGSIVANALRARGFEARATSYLDHWILCYSQPLQPDRDTYLALVQALEDAFSDRRSATVFGVTRPRFGPEGFVKNMSEAEDLLRRGGRGKVRTTRVNSRESAATQLIKEATADPVLLRPAEDLLADLTRPENHHLLETLTVYLDLESNVAKTARRLNLHRNSVINRISRAEEVLRASLEDPDIRLALRLAIRTFTDVGVP